MTNARILVVEDEAIIARDIQNMLKKLGYTVSAAASYGEEAIKKVEETLPDLVLMDIVLEGDMDGVKAAEQIRDCFDIPVVYLTAYSDDSTLQRAKITEPYGYILKPFQERELYTTIEMALYKHKMERQLRESEKKYRHLIENAQEGIWVFDIEAEISFVNASMAEMLGYSVDEMIGRSVFSFMDESGVAAAKCYLETVKQNGRGRCDLELFRKDGKRIYTSRTCSAIVADANCIGFFSFVSDITERKLAKETINRLARQNELILNSAGEGIFGLDVEGNSTFVNPAAARLFGWKAEELVGRAMHNILHHSKSDETPYPQKDCPTCDVLRKGTTYHVDHEVFWRKDGTSFPVEYISKPILEQGEIVGAVVTFNDITERKRAEEELQAAYDQSIIYAQELKKQIEERKRTEEEKKKVEAQLIHAQKMEAVGRLAGGVAHDFNNLMAVVIGYSDLMLMRLSKEDPLCKNVEEIKKAGERAGSLTRQLLAFSRKQILKPKVININEIITNMKNMLGRLIGEDVQLETVLDSELGRVECDPAQIEQIIMNLVINARDAMPRGGKVSIETTNVDLDETYAGKHGIELKAGPYLLLEVSDTGMGMDKDVQNQIFEPFFTTKEKGKGTGLGLSTVYGIIKQSGGFIWVYSEVGLGTTFKIYLPVVYKELESAQKEQIPVSDLRGSETILVVEDDDSVRNMTRHVLHQYGYKVLEASSGEEALQISRQHTEPIQLLLTDVIMFEMGGRDLAELLESYRPETKVLYMSGYTENAVVQHGVLKQDVEFIEKPFSPKGLVRKVREVLNTSKND